MHIKSAPLFAAGSTRISRAWGVSTSAGPRRMLNPLYPLVSSGMNDLLPPVRSAPGRAQRACDSLWSSPAPVLSLQLPRLNSPTKATATMTAELHQDECAGERKGGQRWAARPFLTSLLERDVVDPEAGRQSEVGRCAELDPNGLTTPVREAERLLRVVAGRRLVGVGVRGQRGE